MNRIRNEYKKVTTDTKGIQNIIRQCLKNLCSTKLENLKEVDKFCNSSKPPKLIQEVPNNLNRSV